MLTNDLVPCFVQMFKTDSKTGYEKALLVGVFDKTTTDLDCCIFWEHIGFGDMLAYEAVHCPKCGAIIERRARGGPRLLVW